MSIGKAIDRRQTIFGCNLNHRKEFNSPLLPHFIRNKVYVPILVVAIFHIKGQKQGETSF